MDHLGWGRSLIADSLAFHLLFVTFGVGLPVMICLLELYALITKSPQARQVARTWTKALIILFVAGAVSGTVISLQFSLLWPKYMAFISKTVGVSFALEGIAFTIEALFLSIYALSWDRFKPWWHWVCGAIVALSSVGSAFFITTANAFMNTPRGFNVDATGTPVNVDIARAVFNPATPHETTHSITAYIFTTILVLLAIYAVLYWRKAHSSWMPKLMVGLAILAVITGSILALLGDNSGKDLALYEPQKLAAMEGLQKTQTNAPLTIGGIVQGNEVKYGLQVPGLLSFLATGNFGGKVIGLNDIPATQRPPGYIHYFFDAMVLIGFSCIGIPLLFLLLAKFKKDWAYSKVTLALLVLGGILPLLAVEFGWMLTEFGRQPYIIWGVMRVSDALTTSPLVLQLAVIFPLFFVALLGITIYVLIHALKGKKPKATV